MENKFTEKKVVHKIIIALVFLIFFNWIYPCIPVYAADDDEETTEEAPWGVLLEPLIGLVSGLGEGVIWLIQSNLIGISPASIYIDINGDDGVWGFFGGLIGTAGGAAIGALAVAFTVGTGGLGAIALGAAAAVAGGAVGHVAGNWAGGALEDMFSDDFYLPLYAISPAEIFSDQIPALDINFINPSNPAEQEITGEDGETRTIYDSAAVLAPQISKWYVALRNLVLVGLMVVLLYIGIRIVISSTAGEKAKYKEHIKDWLIAVILVIFMHYIMAFAITLTQYVTDLLNKSNEVVSFPLAENTVNAVENAAQVEIKKSSDGNYYYYTNLMGYARLMQQANLGYGQFTWNSIGYTIVFLALVIYTVMFLIIYLKRVIYMAFLTMIAPLVALTYPIDKISDGQAQAFNMWIKEYVYNLLLQPFHLLLYTMLVGSVMDLAIDNMVYALVALGFLIPAEKLLRRFFGFDQKAPEAGSIVGGVVGGSLAMSAINNLRRIGSVPHKSNGEKPGESGDKGNSPKARLTARKPDSDKKTSVEDLLIDEDPGSGNNPPGSSGTSNLNNSATVRTAMPPNVNPSIASSGDGDADGDKDNAPKDFDPYSDYEVFDSGKFSTEDIGNWAKNLPPIRGVNDKIEEKRNDYQNWLKETPKTPEERDKKRRKIRAIRSFTSGVGTAAHFTKKGLTEVGKRAPRVVTKAALGATLGTVGVAAGLASGDWSNIATYGAAAAGVGASVGEGLSNVVGNAGRGAKGVTENVKADYMDRRYTKSVREALQNKKADEEWRKSKDVIKMYKDEFGKDYKAAMDKAQQYRQYGVTDDKATIKNIKDVGIEGTPTREDIATTRIASSVSTEKDLKSVTDRLRNNGVAEEKIKNIEKSVRKYNISGNFV